MSSYRNRRTVARLETNSISSQSITRFMFDSTAMSAWTLAATVCACATALGVLRSFMRRHGFKSVSSLNDLSSFVQEEVVSQNEHLTVLLGRFIWQPHDQKALIKLSLRAQDATAVAPNLETALSSYSGAEYAYYSATTSLLSLLRSKSLRPCYTLEVIAPASEKQIARSRPQPGVFVVETADTYRRVVKPYIDSLDPAASAQLPYPRASPLRPRSCPHERALTASILLPATSFSCRPLRALSCERPLAHSCVDLQVPRPEQRTRASALQ